MEPSTVPPGWSSCRPFSISSDLHRRRDQPWLMGMVLHFHTASRSSSHITFTEWPQFPWTAQKVMAIEHRKECVLQSNGWQGAGRGWRPFLGSVTIRTISSLRLPRSVWCISVGKWPTLIGVSEVNFRTSRIPIGHDGDPRRVFRRNKLSSGPLQIYNADCHLFCCRHTYYSIWKWKVSAACTT